MGDGVRGAGNVLAALDRRPPTSQYWSLTLLATLGGFLFGFDTANIGSALPFLPYDLGSFWTGYLVAGASLGAAAGALLAGPLTDRFGRKSLLIVDAGLYAAGALLSAFAWDAWVLILARTIIAGWPSVPTPRSPPPTSPNMRRANGGASSACSSSG